jgi:hypothetical protein
MTPALVRVPHPELSLWQSAVHEVLADSLSGGDVSSPLVRSHHHAAEADAHARDMLDPATHPRLRHIVELARRVHLSGVAARAAALVEAAGTYSNRDPEFMVKCVGRFVEFYGLGQRAEYRDWTRAGGGDPSFGEVDWRVPAGARIAVIGDWGTGLDDARALLTGLVTRCRPAVLLHLGDIYYSGTPREARYNFAEVVDAVFAEHPPRLPVFNLPGNHDYYSGGGGFYGLLDMLNEGAARQPASYFCLRSVDGRWQLVGVDTGYHDRVPGIAFDPAYAAPALHPSEVDWLRHKLDGFAGRTLLFSHHQLFSAHMTLNGRKSGRPRRNLNDSLLGAVSGQLGRIALWMWGHEHSLAIYEDGLEGVARCRLVGCSAFETATGDDPYRVRYPDVPYRRDPEVRLSQAGGRYSHGAAVIDLGEEAVEYYELPPWTDAAPVPAPSLNLLYREKLAR